MNDVCEVCSNTIKNGISIIDSSGRVICINCHNERKKRYRRKV